jgi:hypothetical protein
MRIAKLSLVELWFLVIVAILLAARLVVAFHTPAFNLYSADWNISEWLINYSGGFVRRGLGGELLLAFSRTTHVDILVLISGFSLLVYALCCISFARRVAASVPSVPLRVAVLFNPLLLIFPVISGNTFLRKDVVFLGFTILSIRVAEWLVDGIRVRRTQRLWWYSLFLCASGAGLTLFHEGISIFAWLPINFVILYSMVRKSGSGFRRAVVITTLAASPSIALFIASSLMHGSQSGAISICQSWQQYGMTFECTYTDKVTKFGFPIAADGFPVAVDAISWPTLRGFSMTASLFFGKRILATLLFMLSSVVAAAIMIYSISDTFPGEELKKRTEFVTTVGCMLVFALPLFLLGWDWGRWCFILSSQAVFFMMSPKLRFVAKDFVQPLLNRWTSDAINNMCSSIDTFTKRIMPAGIYRAFVVLALPVMVFPNYQDVFNGFFIRSINTLVEALKLGWH